MTGEHMPRCMVPGEGFAEWLLGMVTSPARAEAIVGDLAEQAEGSTAWFWLCTLRIAAACARQSLFSSSTQVTEMSSDSLDFLSTIWRHKWLLATCVLVSVIATRTALTFYPSRYRSESMVTVVPQRVPDEFVHAPQRTSLDPEHVTSIRQQILSRTRLEQIVREFDLYSEARRHEQMEDIVQQMRRNIRLEIVGNDSVRVGFDGSNPRIVMRVAERITMLFMNENLEERSTIAQNTSEFLESELENTRRLLTEQENRLDAATRTGRQPTKADTIEYEVLQQEYRDLLVKREAALIAAKMETRQIGEQFRLIEAPRVPREPVAPNRTAATASGAAAGLGIGVVLIGINTRRRRVADDVPVRRGVQT